MFLFMFSPPASVHGGGVVGLSFVLASEISHALCSLLFQTLSTPCPVMGDFFFFFF